MGRRNEETDSFFGTKKTSELTFQLFIQLIFGVFSLNPKSMRWFNVKRVLICLFIFPIFIFILVSNRLFLLLDYIFFPHFLRQKINEPVYIISAPRSATTYLFHSMSQIKERYTSVKLWEIIFAPSIVQKYILLGVFKIDGYLYSPLKKSVRFIENLLIGKFKKIHVIGLELPEEDEGFLIWNFSTLYLTFFYSDSNFFHRFYQFDKSMDSKSRARIMNTYRNYIKRHNFVFNRQGKRQFLSKNPLMMNKIESLHSIFPNARIININRNVADTLPSTLALNRSIYAAFTSAKTPEQVEVQTIEQLIGWYAMANKSLTTHFPDRHIKVDFKKLIRQDFEEITRIADFLGLSFNDIVLPAKNGKKMHKNTNPYQRLTKEELNPILEKLPFMVEYCD